MRVSPREIVLAMTTAAVALFGGSALLARPKIQEWKKLRVEQAGVIGKIERDKQLVAKKDDLRKKFDELSKMLPQHPADKKMGVHWQRIVGTLASKRGVTLRKLKPGTEEKRGDVCELLIDCPVWEGSLDSIVHFLFDLQVEAAMLDIRHLVIKPKAKGLFGGRFKLYCAYTRGPVNRGKADSRTEK